MCVASSVRTLTLIKRNILDAHSTHHSLTDLVMASANAPQSSFSPPQPCLENRARRISSPGLYWPSARLDPSAAKAIYNLTVCKRWKSITASTARLRAVDRRDLRRGSVRIGPIRHAGAPVPGRPFSSPQTSLRCGCWQVDQFARGLSNDQSWDRRVRLAPS